MPITLIVALVLLAFAAAWTLPPILAGRAHLGAYLTLTIDVLLIVGLIRGGRAARLLALVVGGLNVLIGAIGILRFGGSVASMNFAQHVVVFFPPILGAYLLWCLNRGDVKAWLLDRRASPASTPPR